MNIHQQKFIMFIPLPFYTSLKIYFADKSLTLSSLIIINDKSCDHPPQTLV